MQSKIRSVFAAKRLFRFLDPIFRQIEMEVFFVVSPHAQHSSSPEKDLLPEGHVRSMQRLMDVLFQQQSSAGVFDHASSTGRRATFPDNIVETGTRRPLGRHVWPWGFTLGYVFSATVSHFSDFFALSSSLSVGHWKLSILKDIATIKLHFHVIFISRLDFLSSFLCFLPLSSSAPSLSASVGFKCLLYKLTFWMAFPVFVCSLYIFLCLTEFLCKECPRVHIHFDRVDINEIPPEPEFFRRWLHERFEIKDRWVCQDAAFLVDE